MNIVADSVEVDFIRRVFQKQKENQYKVGLSSARERKEKLKKLKSALESGWRDKFKAALKKDFAKPEAEVDMTEIYPVISEIKHAITHLDEWMSDQYVKTPLAFLGSSSYIKYEPKGVCLILSPWNFPVNLCLGPMVSAIAAGNTVIIKPSEYTVHTSALIKELITSLFNEEEVCVIEGGVETSTVLLELPFNHIFFTGSPEVGKIIMRAASKNLTSVTLELGGKSPTIIDDTADLKMAVRRIATAKFANAGQICIAPDYVLVQESVKQRFIELMRECIGQYYGTDPTQSTDYARLINEKHTGRMVKYLEDAVAKGATIHGGNVDSGSNYVQPTLVADIALDSELMTNEIFGPILPIITFRNLEEVVQIINKGEKPLALYVYSKSQTNIDFVINNTRAGDTCINNSAIHFYNVDLPFGGSNNSGIGKAHGFFGFQAFSNERGIYRQHLPGAIDLLTPPFNNWKKKLIELTLKYF